MTPANTARAPRPASTARALHPQRVQHIVVTRLCVRLAQQPLRDDEQQRERHEERDQPKGDGLRPDRGLDLRLLQLPAHDEPGRRALRQSLDALGERVEQRRDRLQVHVHDRVRHDLVAVAAAANSGVRCSAGDRSGPSGGNSSGDASMPVIRNVTSGPSASASIDVLLAPGSPARRAPKLLRSWSAVASNPDACTNRSRNVLADLEVQPLGEHEAGGRLVGPRRGWRRGPTPSTTARWTSPSRSSSGIIGKQVDRPHAPAVAGAPREQQAHVGPGRRSRPAAARRCRRGRPRTSRRGRRGCSRPRARRPRSSRRRTPDTRRGCGPRPRAAPGRPHPRGRRRGRRPARQPNACAARLAARVTIAATRVLLPGALSFRGTTREVHAPSEPWGRGTIMLMREPTRTPARNGRFQARAVGVAVLALGLALVVPASPARRAADVGVKDRVEELRRCRAAVTAVRPGPGRHRVRRSRSARRRTDRSDLRAAPGRARSTGTASTRARSSSTSAALRATNSAKTHAALEARLRAMDSW